MVESAYNNTKNAEFLGVTPDSDSSSGGVTSDPDSPSIDVTSDSDSPSVDVISDSDSPSIDVTSDSKSPSGGVTSDSTSLSGDVTPDSTSLSGDGTSDSESLSGDVTSDSESPSGGVTTDSDARQSILLETQDHIAEEQKSQERNFDKAKVNIQVEIEDWVLVHGDAHQSATPEAKEEPKTRTDPQQIIHDLSDVVALGAKAIKEKIPDLKILPDVYRPEYIDKSTFAELTAFFNKIEVMCVIYELTGIEMIGSVALLSGGHFRPMVVQWARQNAARMNEKNIYRQFRKDISNQFYDEKQRIQDYVRKFKKLRQTGTVEAFNEQFLEIMQMAPLDHEYQKLFYVEKLKPAIGSFLIGRNHLTLNEMMQVAADYEALATKRGSSTAIERGRPTEKKGSSVVKCKNCNRMGHSWKKCPYEAVCFKCKDPEHPVRECPYSRKARYRIY